MILVDFINLYLQYPKKINTIIEVSWLLGVTIFPGMLSNTKKIKIKL